VPWFNKSLQLKEYNKIKKTNINLLIFIGIISIFFVTTTPEIIKLLSTQEYYSAKWIVAPIVLGTIAQFSYGFYSTLELFHKKTIYISVNTLLIALINILLNWLLIPKYGFFAAAYTTYISYILLVCLHYFTVKWILKIDIYKKNSSFFLIQGIFFLFSTVIVFLYDYVLIRYSFFFIAFFIFYILNSRNINMIISNFYNIFFTRQVKE
jgi:O-antigen/teichoic acid export membrane protein